MRRKRGKAYKVGIPDVVGDIRGRALWCEVKVGKDPLSKDQAEFILAARRRGALALVVKDSIDTFVETVQRELGKFGDLLQPCSS